MHRAGGPALQGEHGTFNAYNPPTGRRLSTPFVPATPETLQHATPCNPPRFEREERRDLLNTIAVHAQHHVDDILVMARRETGLSRKRLGREFDRMVGTLSMFARVVEESSWVNAAIDLPGPGMIGPAHDVRRMLVPLGPIVVFGASNFPLAYGVLGGDSASALAAGCAVIVKGHPLHPGTGELLARVCVDAMLECLDEQHYGQFSFIQSGGDRNEHIGQTLVQSQWVRGVGFTGSATGGMALDRLARQRRDPIPVFAEMGSSNMVFVGEHYARQHAEQLADELARSVLDSSGQQCTKPGQIFLPTGEAGTRFMTRFKERLSAWRPRALLGASVVKHFNESVTRCTEGPSGTAVMVWRPTLHPARGPMAVAPTIVQVRDEWTWEHARIEHEIFGPAVVVIPSDEPLIMLDKIRCSNPCLVASVYALPLDLEQRHWTSRDISQHAGRLCFNTPPTGVRVCTGMVHGGPFPATNAPQTTAVGPLAIERWCRPVCYQNFPDALLPPELQDANVLGIERVVNGVRTRAPVTR